ncbi:MAG TPA: 50S ribosomal protein L29 [Chthonomonadales bacterium]|nr:50S ribosomal protein L29 [Chthonomonadales bacterium]
MLDRLRRLTDRELADELQKQRERLFTLRRDNVSRQLGNSAAIPQTRRMIARIITLIRERELVAGGGS